MSNTQVIESNTKTVAVTLVKASTLKTRLTTLNNNSKANTLSLAYYTMINGNVAPLTGCNRSITTLLDRVYRQFICAKWDSKENTWSYNKARATKLLSDLGLKFNESTFAEFVDAVEAFEATLLAKQAAEKEEQDALTDEQKLQKSKDRVLGYMTKCGLSVIQLKDLVAQIEREQAKADRASIKEPTATA